MLVDRIGGNMNKLKVTLCALLVLCCGFMFTACGDTPPNNKPEGKVSVVKLGENNTTWYDTLDEAVENAGVNATVKLYADITGNGVRVLGTQSVTLDFNGHTYTLDGSMVGSTGTETNGFQFLKGANVTLKNGTIKQGENGCKIMLQNYSNLTVDNMKLDGTNENASKVCTYVLSNNFGTATIKGNSQLIAPEGQVAFDLWYGMNAQGQYDDGIAVTFDETFTGVVTGKIEYGAHNRAKDFADWEEKTVLVIKNGTFNGELTASNGNDLANANVSVTGGKFTDETLANKNAEGYEVNIEVVDETTYYVVSAVEVQE